MSFLHHLMVRQVRLPRGFWEKIPDRSARDRWPACCREERSTKMSYQKLLQWVIGSTLVVLLLVRCGAPPATPVAPTIPPTATPIPSTATPVPPTDTPTPKPPTATPTETFTLATSAEEIVGTWHKRSLYIRFDEDGTFREAYSLDGLDRPFSINSYQFEGTQIVTTEVSVSGVPSCGDMIGIYEIRLLESGNIQIVTIKDQCHPRAGFISGEKELIR